MFGKWKFERRAPDLRATGPLRCGPYICRLFCWISPITDDIYYVTENPHVSRRILPGTQSVGRFTHTCLANWQTGDLDVACAGLPNLRPEKLAVII